VKVTIMLEELLALGHSGAKYDAWLIKIGDGEQLGSGFVAVSPNSKIPALVPSVFLCPSITIGFRPTMRWTFSAARESALLLTACHSCNPGLTRR